MSNNVSTDYVSMAKIMILQLSDLGFKLEKGMKVLDFGCGAGGLVKAFNELGYDAYGVDIIDCEALDSEHFAKIGFDPYGFPFEDGTFDLVFSTSVFEHALNTKECIDEIHRVMKTGGVALHSLPSRYRTREAHIFVPFAGCIQADWWLKLWARLGVRNEFQTGLDWKETFNRNKGFCKEGLNYNKYHQLKKLYSESFDDVKFVVKERIKYNPGRTAKILRAIPIPGFVFIVYFFREWLWFMRKN